MSKPEFRMIDTNGIKIRAAVQGEGPLVVMVHGFPESWYSWRHQMAPLAAAGFTACAIDVRGYGGSDKPHPVEAYAMTEMTAASGLARTWRAPLPSRLTSTVSPMPAWLLSRAMKSPSSGWPGSASGWTTSSRRFL